MESIIGGSDGPTSVFLSGGLSIVIVAVAAIIVAGVTVWLWVNNRK